ncbi:MAG TPA: SCO family protein [Gammaproteobacteria bacterium]
MNIATRFRTVILLMFAAASLNAFAGELPEDSVYGMDATLQTHRGDELSLASLEGKPVIVSMFYGSCPHVCPMLISTIQQVERQLSAGEREGLRVAMISIDPARDTPEHLRAIAERRGVNNDRWILARTSAARTRPLAAVLGIKYRALPDGDFNHTSVLILLDAQGRQLARSSTLGVPDEAFVRRVEAALRSTAP